MSAMSSIPALLAKSMSYHDRQPVGETMARVTNDVREMNLMMNPGVNLIAGANMFLIMPALYAPGIHPDLIVMPMFFILAHIAVQIYFIKRLLPDRARRAPPFRKNERPTGGVA